jgi:hypothetical protein
VKLEGEGVYIPVNCISAREINGKAVVKGADLSKFSMRSTNKELLIEAYKRRKFKASNCELVECATIADRIESLSIGTRGKCKCKR